MKKTINLICLLLVAMSLNLRAQVFYNAADFPILGKISEETETRYERLPIHLKDVIRKPVWDLGKNTAGLAVRFSSNTTSVSAKWKALNNTQMDHMTAVGIKGLDLYVLENNEWQFVNSARIRGAKEEFKSTIISNMSAKDREYMLYLPLYDGVVNLEIGIDSLAQINQPKVDRPKRNKPVVAYGTSILQGGCASRAGMAHISILGRWFDREFINLGFSGNAKLDYEIAEIMAAKDASLYILDFMPNVDYKMVDEKLEQFYKIIRAKAKDTPILFIENPIFPTTVYDLEMKEAIERKNKSLRVVFEKLKKGDKNIYFVSSASMIGLDNEATVDGVHFTDLGFMRYAEYLKPILTRFLKN